MFNLISGFLRPEGGTIRFAGSRIDGLRGDVIARAGLVRAFQTARVLTRMRVLDNLLLAAKHQPGERLGMGWPSADDTDPGRATGRRP
jgi:ABC-type branched-subunit amino acid transport system ATPase component